jgi:two-component system LytT family response regulator
MKKIKPIRIAIIDDHQDYIDSLKEHLLFIQDTEVCGSATRYKQAKDLLLTKKPDLVFMDIEMPCKNGFELLNEVRSKGAEFSVIFHTAYDQYMIQALRESAFDFILKPVDPDELKNAITRFKEKWGTKIGHSTLPLYQGTSGITEIIALPTSLGLRFIEKNRILLFRSAHGKSSWEVLLIDQTSIKLGANTTAERIAQLLTKERFVQISQSCIINLAYLSLVEFKTRNCLLVPPFDNMQLTVSRSFLSKLKEMYEVF